MNEEKLVTQIMCYYNEERYLKEAINAILNQTYSNLELILINDGSTDRSADIAASFHDKRIVNVSNKENHGLAWCRNQGLSMAKGEYIGFVDADDIARKDKLKIMAGYLDNHEDIMVLGGGYIFIDKHGNKLPKKAEERVCGDINIRAYMLFHNCIAGPCAIFRREVIDKYHIVHDTTMRTSQDYYFWHECLRYGKFENLNEPMLYYRIGHNSQCDRSRKRDPKQYEDIIFRIFQHAWKIRGFQLNENDISYICKYIFRMEHIEKLSDYIKGYRLYRKIKRQEAELNLIEGPRILSLYREDMKRQVLAGVKRVMKLLGL